MNTATGVFWTIVIGAVVVIAFVWFYNFFISNCMANGFTHDYCVAQYLN